MGPGAVPPPDRAGGVRRRGGRAADGGARRVTNGEDRERGVFEMSYVYVALSVLPSVAVLGLLVYVVRAVSVRIVWRESHVRRLDRTA
jgi:hypothetical protein